MDSLVFIYGDTKKRLSFGRICIGPQLKMVASEELQCKLIFVNVCINMILELLTC
jgi:hypothetical protein